MADSIRRCRPAAPTAPGSIFTLVELLLRHSTLERKDIKNLRILSKAARGAHDRLSTRLSFSGKRWKRTPLHKMLSCAQGVLSRGCQPFEVALRLEGHKPQSFATQNAALSILRAFAGTAAVSPSSTATTSLQLDVMLMTPRLAPALGLAFPHLSKLKLLTPKDLFKPLPETSRGAKKARTQTQAVCAGLWRLMCGGSAAGGGIGTSSSPPVLAGVTQVEVAGLRCLPNELAHVLFGAGGVQGLSIKFDEGYKLMEPEPLRMGDWAVGQLATMVQLQSLHLSHCEGRHMLTLASGLTNLTSLRLKRISVAGSPARDGKELQPLAVRALRGLVQLQELALPGVSLQLQQEWDLQEALPALTALDVGELALPDMQEAWEGEEEGQGEAHLWVGEGQGGGGDAAGGVAVVAPAAAAAVAAAAVVAAAAPAVMTRRWRVPLRLQRLRVRQAECWCLSADYPRGRVDVLAGPAPELVIVRMQSKCGCTYPRSCTIPVAAFSELAGLQELALDNLSLQAEGLQALTSLTSLRVGDLLGGRAAAKAAGAFGAKLRALFAGAGDNPAEWEAALTAEAEAAPDQAIEPALIAAAVAAQDALEAAFASTAATAAAAASSVCLPPGLVRLYAYGGIHENRCCNPFEVQRGMTGASLTYLEIFQRRQERPTDFSAFKSLQCLTNLRVRGKVQVAGMEALTALTSLQADWLVAPPVEEVRPAAQQQVPADQAAGTALALTRVGAVGAGEAQPAVAAAAPPPTAAVALAAHAGEADGALPAPILPLPMAAPVSLEYGAQGSGALPPHLRSLRVSGCIDSGTSQSLGLLAGLRATPSLTDLDLAAGLWLADGQDVAPDGELLPAGEAALCGALTLLGGLQSRQLRPPGAARSLTVGYLRSGERIVQLASVLLPAGSGASAASGGGAGSSSSGWNRGSGGGIAACSAAGTAAADVAAGGRGCGEEPLSSVPHHGVWLAALSPLQLTVLDLCRIQLGEQDLAIIAARLTTLEELTLSKCDVLPRALPRLGAAPRLAKLSVQVDSWLRPLYKPAPRGEGDGEEVQGQPSACKSGNSDSDSRDSEGGAEGADGGSDGGRDGAGGGGSSNGDESGDADPACSASVPPTSVAEGIAAGVLALCRAGAAPAGRLWRVELTAASDGMRLRGLLAMEVAPRLAEAGLDAGMVVAAPTDKQFNIWWLYG